jgi:hypothetical protein
LTKIDAHLQIFSTDVKPEFCPAFMQLLASEILKELETADHCAVYEEDLKRVWPVGDPDREAKIAQFAREHDWRLRYYREGLCAIFDREPSGLQ